ncbi:uncharacterized protein DNG_04229 [Cephalotrichum gorgonifer]|uniref:Uncharacterized protein n=1 Tax=Cephalotrichum gorgonifer TaxID=2041049 RepID=A0AAE8MYH3_9PEZI|nr:uncharacterized protein DNG_04229 [Cephalotrichum gorgonifer]
MRMPDATSKSFPGGASDKILAFIAVALQRSEELGSAPDKGQGESEEYIQIRREALQARIEHGRIEHGRIEKYEKRSSALKKPSSLTKPSAMKQLSAAKPSSGTRKHPAKKSSSGIKKSPAKNEAASDHIAGSSAPDFCTEDVLSLLRHLNQAREANTEAIKANTKATKAHTEAIDAQTKELSLFRRLVQESEANAQTKLQENGADSPNAEIAPTQSAGRLGWLWS